MQISFRWKRLVFAALAGAVYWGTSVAPALAVEGEPYINFETIPTRSLALSPTGDRLYVANTPDSRLEIFSITEDGLELTGSVTVGLDPIALGVTPDGTQVWVVNHVSDNVSVVDVSAPVPHVIKTLLVGDEPRDIVFAGPSGDRAFITAVRRGQNHPADTANQLQTPGLGRADVWVFDRNNLGSSAGGDPITLVTLFSDKPGAVTATPDGSKVYVSIFSSGNQTSVVNDSAVCGERGRAGFRQFSVERSGPCLLGFGGGSFSEREKLDRFGIRPGGVAPGGVPSPNRNQADGALNPRTGIIVKNNPDTGEWLDAAGRDWRDAVPFALPDNDVFVLDAMANPPRQSDVYNTVGTLNFNAAVNPANGKVYVSTIDAVNTNRFLSVPALNAFPNPNRENGAARTADPLTGMTLNGHLYESRISILGPDGSVTSRHLNKHIDYEVVPSPPGVKERSTANPQGLAFSADGSRLFLAALGSNKIMVFKTQELDDDTFSPGETQIQLSGEGGPADLVLNEARGEMYVYKRFDNSVVTVDLASLQPTAEVAMFSPEPQRVIEGRKFFYDAIRGSSNGEANCNVCHPAGDKDDLAWNLGSPFAGLQDNPNDFVQIMAGGLLGGIVGPVDSGETDTLRLLGGLLGIDPLNGTDPTREFNPLKGPMTVLTMRGIKDSGPMFWRGDATNPRNQFDERANFQNFNVVFPALLGREDVLADRDFQQLTNWILSIVPPPNPHRGLDNSLNRSQARGQRLFFEGRPGRGEGLLDLFPNATDEVFVCVDCHSVDRTRGFFGTGGLNVVEGETQFFKVTQLRTVYDKVGMFGPTIGGFPFQGEQIRGTGVLHDGSAAGAETFLSANVFDTDEDETRDVSNFSYAFDSNLAPIVGQQITVTSSSGADTFQRVALLIDRARTTFAIKGDPRARECEVIAKGVVDGRETGFLFSGSRFRTTFTADTGRSVSLNTLLGLARTPGQEITFTCVYPGGGRRLALDRNGDGVLDGQ